MRHNGLGQLLEHPWGKGVAHAILKILDDQGRVALEIHPGFCLDDWKWRSGTPPDSREPKQSH